MRRAFKISLWLLIIVWATAMLALTPRFVMLHHETRNLERVFDEYRTALVNRNFAQAYQFCGDDFQRAMSFDQFVALQESLENQYGSLKSIRETARDVDGKGTPIYWRAVIEADFVYKKQGTRFRLVFDKEHGHWAMYGGEKL